MNDKAISSPLGKSFEPVYFPELEEICRRLDDFYRLLGVQKGTPPSSMLRGALYAMRKEYRDSNPDWMAQVAHSLREIFYGLGLDFPSAFENFGSTFAEKIREQKVGEYYNFITEIAHHNFEKAQKSPLIGGSKNGPVEISPEAFEAVVFQFGDIIFTVLRRQIDAHHEIGAILKKNPDETKLVHVRELATLNSDARHYFYAHADERWLSWLWDNGFLDVIKQKGEETSSYGYRTQELNYLVKVTKKASREVVDIMLQVPISPESYSPEVIDRFLQICGLLPTEQLARVVGKIRDEKWVVLMQAFNHWEYEFEKLFKTLAEAKDDKSLLVLAEAVLFIRSKDELEKKTDLLFMDNPFYFNDLQAVGVFNRLIAVNDDYAESAFALALSILGDLIRLGDQPKEKEIFKMNDPFPLYEANFFNLGLEQTDHLSSKDDVRELAAVIKILAERLMGTKCLQTAAVRGYFEKFIHPLPDSRLKWRLGLFVISLCPQAFTEELKAAFFRIIGEKHYQQLIVFPEYKEALGKCFKVLAEDDKHKYVNSIIQFFSEQGEDDKEKKYALSEGSEILSMISGDLTKGEKELAEKAGFKIQPGFKPEPMIGSMRSGTIRPMPPEPFGDKPIKKIAQLLQVEWKPENLNKLNTSEDFLTPKSAEGAGEELRRDISKRLQDYLDSAPLFFARDTLDRHYTYSFLRGVQEAIHEKKADLNGANWEGLMVLCKAIKESGETKPFEREKRKGGEYDYWLAGWDAVHSALADLIQELLSRKEVKLMIDFPKYHADLLGIISYLLGYPDPTPEDEQPETAKSKSSRGQDNTMIVTDPFTMAINSVRGRAFQSFVQFVYKDGKTISFELKALYETVLKKENTRALMFLFGHYFPSFYYRDEKWAKDLLPQIFPEQVEKKNLYTAAWEGYLANSLYAELFHDPDIQKLYLRGLGLTQADYPQQAHFKKPDEALATHLALAYMHYKDFHSKHPLFRAFWEKGTPEQDAAFISLIGRKYINGDNAEANALLAKDPESKKRLKNFWEWSLENCKDPKPFVEFGFWIGLKKGIFEPVELAALVRKTLEKTKGALEWEHGLMDTIIVLADTAPKDTLEILKLYWREGCLKGLNRLPFHLDDKWIEAFKILYGKTETKEGAIKLIDDLIRDGGSNFWPLEEII